MTIHVERPDANLYSGCLIDGKPVMAEMANEEEGWAIVLVDNRDDCIIERKLVRGKVELVKKVL